jgi:hypothetical protein
MRFLSDIEALIRGTILADKIGYLLLLCLLGFVLFIWWSRNFNK